ncbi:MAG: hypothetical protein K1X72_05995 [Pyrinomonadaceae bacterium]|nr:hypothetical protein [Pyrinomonadaceae bacterium]
MKRINLCLITAVILILAGNSFGQTSQEVSRNSRVKAKTRKPQSKVWSDATGHFDLIKSKTRKSGVKAKTIKRKSAIWGQETNYRKKNQHISNPIGTDGNIAVRRKHQHRKRKS